MDLTLSQAEARLVHDVTALAEPASRGSWGDVVAAAPGYDPDLWARLLAHGGLTDAAAATDGVTRLAAAAAALAAVPVPSPLHNGLVLSAGILSAAGDGRRLAELAEGRRVAVCLGDPSLVEPQRRPTLIARGDTRGWTISGTARFVPYAETADVLLVVAGASPAAQRASHGDADAPAVLAPVVLVVASTAPGVRLSPVPTIGVDRQCHVRFDGVGVAHDGVVAEPGAADGWLDGVLDRCRTVMAGDMAGAARAALDAAVERAGTRQQFGQPIGSFQAVQHRLADAFVDAVTSADAAFDAAGALDRGDPDARHLAAGAKAHCNEACRRVTAAAHQVFGGEGIYSEHPLHAWHRSVQALVPILGSTHALVSVVGGSILRPA